MLVLIVHNVCTRQDLRELPLNVIFDLYDKLCEKLGVKKEEMSKKDTLPDIMPTGIKVSNKRLF